MKELFNKLFRKDRQSEPPSSIRRRFKVLFPRAINVEWLEDGDQWEVVFHDNQKEKIVRINPDGKMEECRINTNPNNLPGKIMKIMSEKGEVMNVIFIEKPGGTSWEIIYRDKKLDRYLLILGADGEEISCDQL